MTGKTGKRPPAAGPHENLAQKRREERYSVPDDCRQHVKLWVRNEKEYVPAILGNFSRSGILFESPVPLSKGDHTVCIISISLVLARKLAFSIEVKYCYADHGSHITGASIDRISDEHWFDAFVEVYDLIVLRKNSG